MSLFGKIKINNGILVGIDIQKDNCIENGIKVGHFSDEIYH
jgi:hypothetical protein